MGPKSLYPIGSHISPKSRAAAPHHPDAHTRHQTRTQPSAPPTNRYPHRMTSGVFDDRPVMKSTWGRQLDQPRYQALGRCAWKVHLCSANSLLCLATCKNWVLCRRQRDAAVTLASELHSRGLGLGVHGGRHAARMSVHALSSCPRASYVGHRPSPCFAHPPTHAQPARFHTTAFPSTRDRRRNPCRRRCRCQMPCVQRHVQGRPLCRQADCPHAVDQRGHPRALVAPGVGRTHHGPDPGAHRRWNRWALDRLALPNAGCGGTLRQIPCQIWPPEASPNQLLDGGADARRPQSNKIETLLADMAVATHHTYQRPKFPPGSIRLGQSSATATLNRYDAHEDPAVPVSGPPWAWSKWSARLGGGVGAGVGGGGLQPTDAPGAGVGQGLGMQHSG
jgi:hypothetical protein